MNGFIKDENGIWCIPGETYAVKYPEVGNQACEIIEDNDSFWFSHRNKILFEIINNLPFSNNFADIGGGNGFQILALKERIPGKKYFLIEPGYPGCSTARKRGLEDVYNCTFQKFDFNEAQVNGLGLFDVLEHIPDDVKFLNDLYDSMRANSYLYITVPAHQFLWNEVDVFGNHQKRYDKRSLTELVSKTRFTLSFFSYFFSSLVIPTYLLRTIPYKIFGRGSDEEILKKESKSHSPNPIITMALNLFNGPEVRKIRNKGSISFGASCVLVLKK
jgi:SAM-dependent methyltransferase